MPLSASAKPGNDSEVRKRQLLRNTPGMVEEVRQVVQGILGQQIGREDLAKSLRSLGLDSVGMIELIAALEREFRIRILDEEITPEHFRSIDSITGYVEGKR